MNSKHEYNVAGSNFGWDIEAGKFLFAGDDAVLFWISSAMKLFFDTIEEVSGEAATGVVLETAGFRQGSIVGEYFHNLKDISVDQAAELITNTYASAGWGRATVEKLNWDEKTFELYLKDDWEYKINLAQEKKTGGNFLPAHYAGVFTELFETNIGYEIIHSQIENNENTYIKYFPSKKRVSENIHELTRKREAEMIGKLEVLVEEKTNELQSLVKDLSSPMIPVLDGIVVVPLIGKYDENRSEDLVDKVLGNLPSHKAKYLLLDLTGIDKNITSHTAALIEKLGHASSLIGTKTILVGISAESSIIMSQNDITFSDFDCFQSLEHGVYYALAQNGRKII